MKLAIFIFLICIVNNVSGQQGIRIHTDKPVYFPGDTIWYKAYFTHQHRLDTAMKNMGFVIGTANGSVLEDQLRPIYKGISYGEFIIPRDFKEYELYFNVFTKRNINDNKVLNPMEFKIGVFQNNKIISKVEPQVKVFIEGCGLMKKSANLMNLQWNLKQKIQASIKEKNGVILHSFITDSLGQSTISINTENNPLLLHWEYGGNQFIDELPTSKSLVRLRLKERHDSTYLYIDNQSDETALSLQFHIDNFRLLDTTISFEEKGTDSLLINQLLNGRFYGEFTIFHKGYQYAQLKVNQIAEINPTINTETLNLESYGVNEFTVSLPSEASWNSSISVYDGNLPAPIELAYESVNYISFNSGKFKYSYEVVSNTTGSAEVKDSVFVLKGGLIMKGDKLDKFMTVKKKRALKQKAKNEKMRLMSFGYRLLTEPNYFYQEIDFDTLGNLKFPNLTFYDTLETRFVQIDERLKLTDYDVKLRFSSLPKLNKVHISTFLLGQDISQQYVGSYHPDYYQFEFGNSELKDVKIVNKLDPRKQMLRKKYAKNWFLDNEAFLEIDLVNYGLPAWIYTRKELLDYLYHKYPKLRSLEAEFLANNLHNYQMDNEKLPKDVTEIEYIRVYEKYIFNKVGGGAIMFYTTGVYGRNKDIGVSKIHIKKIPGYSKFLDYYSPDYSSVNKPKYDDRLTLFWQPDHGLKKNEKTSFKFFNNSLSKSYFIHLNMISESGSFISKWHLVTP